MNRMLHLRIPESLYDSIIIVSKENGFSNAQEFIRTCLRDSVKEKQLEQSLIKIASVKGSMSSISLQTKKERVKAIKELVKQGDSEILRKYDFN